MTFEKIDSNSSGRRKLRVWPGIVIVILQWLVRFFIPAIVPDSFMIGVLGVLFGFIGIIVWWTFFSRAHRIDRWTGIVWIALSMLGTSFFLHQSISTGNMGLMFPIYSIPGITLAIVLGAIIARNLSDKLRRIVLISAILLSSGIWIFLRSEGIDGEGIANFNWRWAKTAEDSILSKIDNESATNITDSTLNDSVTTWSGFRGNKRDAKVYKTKIKTDWKTSPPVELWRKSIGPGCSSFAVQGNFIFTQEQRGEEECVTCYNLLSGKLVWKHCDKARFWDSHAGAGPRSTPAFHKGRLYTLGATGILNVLDAKNGKEIWSCNAATEAGIKTPIWAFSGSPLIINNLVFVPIAGTLIAYDIESGKQKWIKKADGDCYSSPHDFTINGIHQILFLNESGVSSYNPQDGNLLWNYVWKGNSILQPAQNSDGDILINVSAFSGIMRLNVKTDNHKTEVKEIWTSLDLKVNHNDFVIHKGYVYGIDGFGMACISLDDGKRKWKGGRYGGQILLLADQDLLLNLSEKGDLALIRAIPERFEEVAKIKAIEGKTWNHPVLAGNILLVRNSQEMVAFKL